MTHKHLVTLAKQWLLTAKQCNPVFTEKGSSKTGEMPDAIGWSSKGSFVVECKNSIADFRADAKKSFRASPDSGMGKYRYYLFTTELYSMIPDWDIPAGWGIITPGVFESVKQVRLKYSIVRNFNIQAELYYMRNRLLEIQKFGC